MAILQI
jgi:hypothetical protein